MLRLRRLAVPDLSERGVHVQLRLRQLRQLSERRLRFDLRRLPDVRLRSVHRRLHRGVYVLQRRLLLFAQSMLHRLDPRLLLRRSRLAVLWRRLLRYQCLLSERKSVCTVLPGRHVLLKRQVCCHRGSRLPVLRLRQRWNLRGDVPDRGLLRWRLLPSMLHRSASAVLLFFDKRAVLRRRLLRHQLSVP
jgi:hypothetical protein